VNLEPFISAFERQPVLFIFAALAVAFVFWQMANSRSAKANIVSKESEMSLQTTLSNILEKSIADEQAARNRLQEELNAVRDKTDSLEKLVTEKNLEVVNQRNIITLLQQDVEKLNKKILELTHRNVEITKELESERYNRFAIERERDAYRTAAASVEAIKAIENAISEMIKKIQDEFFRTYESVRTQNLQGNAAILAAVTTNLGEPYEQPNKKQEATLNNPT
jgi:SMC interacting uncharacterized protein involved in chromosome segregation